MTAKPIAPKPLHSVTLRQLQYIVTAAETGNITEAANRLFLSQPSLTAAIREVEGEYGITIFARSGRGIEATPEGEEFLGYARQVLEQANLIEERYRGRSAGKQRFCVSAACRRSTIPSRWKHLSRFCGNTAATAMSFTCAKPRPTTSSTTWRTCEASSGFST